MIRASEQCDELSLGFSTGETRRGHRQVQGPVRPSCCPNACPSVPCRVATSRVLCIFRCTPAGVAAKSTSLATTEHRARRVGAKGFVVRSLERRFQAFVRFMIHVFPGEKPLKGPVILFGAMVEYCPTRDQSRLHQFGKKVPLGMLSDMHKLIAEG